MLFIVPDLMSRQFVAGTFRSFWVQCLQARRAYSNVEVPSLSRLTGVVSLGRTELLRRLRRYEVANRKCLLVKYAKDNRYDEQNVVTHDRMSVSATVSSQLLPLLAKAESYDVIAVDEGQFFPDVVEFCETIANKGKTVLVASLDGTFQRKAFWNTLKLIPLAESVVKLRAICGQCNQDAAFSLLLVDDKKVELIGGADRFQAGLLGGADKYVAVCRQCYHRGSNHTR